MDWLVYQPFPALAKSAYQGGRSADVSATCLTLPNLLNYNNKPVTALFKYYEHIGVEILTAFSGLASQRLRQWAVQQNEL